VYGVFCVLCLWCILCIFLINCIFCIVFIVYIRGTYMYFYGKTCVFIGSVSCGRNYVHGTCVYVYEWARAKRKCNFM